MHEFSQTEASAGAYLFDPDVVRHLPIAAGDLSENMGSSGAPFLNTTYSSSRRSSQTYLSTPGVVAQYLYQLIHDL